MSRRFYFSSARVFFAIFPHAFAHGRHSLLFRLLTPIFFLGLSARNFYRKSELEPFFPTKRASPAKFPPLIRVEKQPSFQPLVLRAALFFPLHEFPSALTVFFFLLFYRFISPLASLF